MLHVFTRCSINGTQLKVFEDGRIFIWKKWSWNAKKEDWFELKGNINNQGGYKQHRTKINYQTYTTSRIIWKAFHPEWDIEDSSPNNTIDHINRNSLDNRLCNLRVATMSEQTLNRKWLNHKKAKGCRFHKKDKKWNARIVIQGKETHLGGFATEAEANTAYLNAKAKHLGN